MTVNNVIMACIDDFLQFFIGRNISCFERISLKGNIIIVVTKRNLTICRIIIIITGRNGCLPPVFLEHLQKRQMKFHNMFFYYCRNKKYFCHRIFNSLSFKFA